MRIRIENMPDRIMGRGLDCKVIPTVCNLKNMLNKLKQVNSDLNQLEQWEKRSYKAYNIEDIKRDILSANQNDWPSIIRNHILTGDKSLFGASCVDVYLVAYVANEFGIGRGVFEKYIFDKQITEKINSVNAIWTVGKGDASILGFLIPMVPLKMLNFSKSGFQGKSFNQQTLSVKLSRSHFFQRSTNIICANWQ